MLKICTTSFVQELWTQYDTGDRRSEGFQKRRMEMQTRIEAAHGSEEETFLSFRVSRIWRKCGQIEKKSQKTNIRTFFFIASDWRFEFTTKIHQRFISF